jgi:regulator of sigma D
VIGNLNGNLGAGNLNQNRKAGIGGAPRSSFSEGSNTALSRLTQTVSQYFQKGAFMIDDKVRIKCTKCSQIFRERAQRVRPGFQTNCQHCNRLITFDMTVDDRNVRKALISAKEIRAVLDEARRAAAVAQQATPVPVMDRSQY